MGEYLKLLFQLMLSPGHGWEDVEAARLHPRILAPRAFYPLTAVTALTTLMAKIFHPMLTVQELVIDAIITFVMFFLGYFIATFVLVALFGVVTRAHTDERRCRIFSMMIIGLLELVTIIGNIIPITMAITWFLPVYVAVIAWKGATFMGVGKEASGRFMLLTIPGVIFPPYLLDLLFQMVLK